MGPSISPRLDWKNIRSSVAKFAIKFKDAKEESSLKQSFWIDFFKIFVIDPVTMGAFEYHVRMFDGTGGRSTTSGPARSSSSTSPLGRTWTMPRSRSSGT